MHRWSEDDDLIAYCLYRFGKGAFGRDLHELGDVLGMGFNSLNLKIANIKAIDGIGGLEQSILNKLCVFSHDTTICLTKKFVKQGMQPYNALPTIRLPRK